ncbi:globin D, coelomic-like [Mercenaria mercenaria]|uniref:globin D, coelomic-like n=1 Tax=Mercenaria mercenaria TaxID=6596 RepID=UPI001E1DD5ED|nr:globin D, coelomic-like [Mercenaria mercenaria]
MGCTQSVTYTKSTCPNAQRTKPQSEMTLAQQTDLKEEEKRIIKSTWKFLTKDLSANGLQVFLKIFELCPEVKKLLKVENVRPSELARNQVIRAHGTRFMNAIGAAVDCLNGQENEHENLDNVLFVLGQKHKGSHEFKSEYFEVFYKALMWRWGLCMGDNFTPEVADTWSHVFLYMLEKLKEGFLSQEN